MNSHRDLLSLGLGLFFGMADANQIAVGNILHRVASRAHLLVHLIAATNAADRNQSIDLCTYTLAIFELRTSGDPARRTDPYGTRAERVRALQCQKPPPIAREQTTEHQRRR